MMSHNGAVEAGIDATEQHAQSWRNDIGYRFIDRGLDRGFSRFVQKSHGILRLAIGGRGKWVELCIALCAAALESFEFIQCPLPSFLPFCCKTPNSY